VIIIHNCSAQVWLQEFGWTEEETAAKIGKRGGACGPVHDALKNEPMFCFGTAVKLFYWSHLVYDMNEEGSRRFSIETALGLFGLDKYELMWEKAEDTKVSILTYVTLRIICVLLHYSHALCVVRLVHRLLSVNHPPVQHAHWCCKSKPVHIVCNDQVCPCICFRCCWPGTPIRCW